MSIKEKEIVSTKDWELAGLIILCIRFVQGWIFWAGGSRRFIYDPYKLDPHAGQWLANKLQGAMPGALLGLSHVISYMLQHFWILYLSLIVFSMLELLSGIALIMGICTRLAALVTVFLSISLMLVFGWEGGTCVDEWTMSICTLSMGLTLFLSGASIYSIGHILIRHHPELIERKWFEIFVSGPWQFRNLHRAALLCLAFTVLFSTTTYNYYRGAIFSPYHPGPVSPTAYHLNFSEGTIKPNGEIIFTLKVDAGNASEPYYIIGAEFLKNNIVMTNWTPQNLSQLPPESVKNLYNYNQIKMGQFGLVAQVGATATITLKASPTSMPLNAKDQYELQLHTIDGKKWPFKLNAM